ncbi:hypothetical protein [Arthrobacter sp. STN4]|uniref:hypothetical protein n=1 Tax=Arthrobacter sp. STN4 TaxID=2923276 RepID=UPI002119C472|nr:hypothetical protein [Arthrobacter sp. STN4]MCQ9164129.1 hypothetical protein [Arthrobacter sp. STN4]
MNEHMFLQDLHSRALPYGSSMVDGFDINISPYSKDVLNLVINALPSNGYRHWQLEESFRDYIQAALWDLVRGELYLEIEYFRSPEDPSGRPIAFRIELLQREFVTKRWGKYRYLSQVGAVDDNSQRWSSKPLHPNNLLVASLPRGLKRELRHTLRVMSASDREARVMTDFTTGAHGSESGFDFGTFQLKSHDIVLRASKATGWTGRGLLAEGLLDPAKAWRAIQFARLTVKLREIATQGLNDAINRAGMRIGFEAELTLSKVLTEDHLDALENDLEAGTRPIEEMFSPKASS